MTSNQIIIWQIHDGKPGHLNQMLGLSNALAELVGVGVHSVETPSLRSCLAGLFAKRFTPERDLPAPDLILGAGHSTHLAVLAAKRAYGGKAIILMKPSLPASLFDLCIVPEHDGASESVSVLTTRGVLNKIRPSSSRNSQTGLLLVGGPSGAHDWSDEQMIDQIAQVAQSDSSVHWHLTTSRRTPSTFLTKLGTCGFNNLHVTPHEQTTPKWLPKQLEHASQVWVSEDSVSMLYEALTSGAAVGVLEVPCKKYGRVAAGMEKLIQAGWVTRLSDWQSGSRLALPPEQLDEARRCAKIISARFLQRAAA